MLKFQLIAVWPEYLSEILLRYYLKQLLFSKYNLVFTMYKELILSLINHLT